MFIFFQMPARISRILLAMVFIACGETILYLHFGSPRFSVPDPQGRISAEQARDYIRQTGNLVVVDVRSRKEFAASHVPEALNLPLHSLPRLAKKLPKESPVLIYCLQGYRALQAYKVLKKLRPDITDIRYVAGWLISLPDY